MWKNTTLLSSSMTCPPSSNCLVVWRRKFITGVTKRSISSTADGRSERSLRSSSHWSGWSKKAAMAPEMRFRVVSLPATVNSRKNSSSSKSESFSPSTSTSVRTLIRSSCGSARFTPNSSEA